MFRKNDTLEIPNSKTFVNEEKVMIPAQYDLTQEDLNIQIQASELSKLMAIIGKVELYLSSTPVLSRKNHDCYS
jgi:hypothetical protein